LLLYQMTIQNVEEIVFVTVPNEHRMWRKLSLLLNQTNIQNVEETVFVTVSNEHTECGAFLGLMVVYSTTKCQELRAKDLAKGMK